MISTKNYPTETWEDFLDNDKSIHLLVNNMLPCWRRIFEKIMTPDRVENIEDTIRSSIKKKFIDGIDVFPYPDLLFHPFNMIDTEHVRVVIIGMDPYPSLDKKTSCPCAMGMSFSSPSGTAIPASLANIYKNMEFFGHHELVSDSPNLEHMFYYGYLFMNASFTVEKGKPGSHSRAWKIITKELVEYMSDHMDDLIFVLWGSDAKKMSLFIDQDKHHIISSGHPSPSALNFQSDATDRFDKIDHFSLIKKIIRQIDQKKDHGRQV